MKGAIEPGGSRGYEPITPRSVGIALFASVVICLLSAYNDCYLRNTYFIGNHFPVTPTAFIVILVVGFNLGVRRFLRVRGFSSGELLLVWAVMGLAGSLSAYAFSGYFPSFVVAPAYLANKSNEWSKYVLDNMPSWMVVSKDPNSTALRWFMEGLPKGERVPWEAWAGPLIGWGGFALLLYASNFALCSLFFRQWSRNERLVFPIVQVPVEVAREPERDGILNSFFRNPVTWVGIAIPVLVWGLRGLRAYYPALPNVPTSWWVGGLFPDRPWNSFNLANAEIFFCVIGLTFFLTVEAGLSFWLFFVLYRAGYVLSAWMGTGGSSGFFSDWGNALPVYETAGAMIVMAFFICWTARRYLAGWAGRVLRGGTDREADTMPPRLAAGLILVGFSGMFLWFLLAGAQWWVAVLALGFWMVMLFVLTRVVAEAGLLFIDTDAEPFGLIPGLFPASWISGPSRVSLAMHYGINTGDMRKLFMPYVINGLKAGEQAGFNPRKFVAVLGVGALLGLGIGTYGFIATSYKIGAINIESWASTMAPFYYIGRAANHLKNPPSYPMLRAGEKEVVPASVAHLVVGGGLTAVMLVLRAKFLWWPLHPYGFIMSGTWAMSRIWFSILIGWIFKAVVMGFGGAQTYRKILPAFLGMALGECVMSFFWMVMGVITGVPGAMIVP